MKTPNNKSCGREEYFASRISRMVALMHGGDQEAKGFYDLLERKNGTKTIRSYSDAGEFVITIRRKDQR